MSLQEQYDDRRISLEKNIAAANSLLAELEQKMHASQDPIEKGRLEVNIEDVTRQLREWEYDLHALTQGKE